MPCLYSIGTDVEQITPAMGWNSVQVAEETVLPLRDLEFTGKKWQDIRTAMNRARKAGVTAEWTSYPTAPLVITDQICAIAEEWAADKRLPEMGFTLGGLDEFHDPDVRLLVAVDQERTVHGVTSWLPVRRGGVLVGWTLDFMRRRADGFNGVMEFLIASAATSCAAEGAEFLSLSGAPLARLDDGEPVGGLQRLLDVTSDRLEPVYGFASLLAFKAKFQPLYRPQYLAYPDPVALPAIANAILRAYLPHLSARQTTRLARAVLR
ncbi:MAG: phosphatidylglycerol lysyltransferase [Pseudonocardiales bacterium]|jgi:phosphatidylglycerol lysyltransferase|nr:phosphatidylglycerol lysyltransferase [Pseudonocardiales bacterium]